MYPIIIISKFWIDSYDIFHFLALLSIVFFGLCLNYRYHKYPLGFGILIFSGIFAKLFSRIFYFLFFIPSESWISFFFLERSGHVFLGGLLGGVLGALLYFEMKKIPKIEGLEIFVPYIPIGGILGRLGCFCAGCCYGTITDSIFGLRFPMGSPAWAEHVSRQLITSDQFFSLPVHPTQLYEIGMWIIAGIILITIRNRKPRKGTLILSFICIYFLMRFVEDFIRADYGKVAWNLDLMQLLALFIIPLSILAILLIYRDKLLRLSLPQKKTPTDIQ